MQMVNGAFDAMWEERNKGVRVLCSVAMFQLWMDYTAGLGNTMHWGPGHYDCYCYPYITIFASWTWITSGPKRCNKDSVARSIRIYSDKLQLVHASCDARRRAMFVL
jgi:hypothetical protein